MPAPPAPSASVFLASMDARDFARSHADRDGAALLTTSRPLGNIRAATKMDHGAT
jgi:hypothetical protein